MATIDEGGLFRMQQKQTALGSHSDEVLGRPVFIILLGLAILSTLALLAQGTFIYYRGFSSDAGIVHVALVSILTVSTWGAVALLRRQVISPRQTVHAYSWTAMVAVVGMVSADYMAGGDNFPVILVTLSVGSFLLGVLCHWKTMLPYSFLTAAVMLVVGILYNDVGSGGGMALGVGLAALSSVAVRALITAKTHEVKLEATNARREAKAAMDAADAMKEAIRIVTHGGEPARTGE